MSFRHDDKKFRNLMKEVVEFSILDFAKRTVEKSSKPLLILQGDKGKFWVCPEKVADRLLEMGYSILDQD